MDQKFSEPWLVEPKPNNAQLDSRPTSAPPVLEIIKEPLALQLQKNQLENGTNDTHEASNEYDKFYESNQHLYPFLRSPLDAEAVQSETPSPRKALFSPKPALYEAGASHPSQRHETPQKLFSQQTHAQNTNNHYNVYPFPPSAGFTGYLPSHQFQTNSADSRREPEFLAEEGDANEPAQQKKSRVDVVKQGRIWNPLPAKPPPSSTTTRNRNKNLGKVAINMDTNLSSSTDDLLMLAGGGPLQRMRVRLAAYEESPPPARRNGMETRGIRVFDSDSDTKKELPEEEEYDDVVHGFGNLSLIPDEETVSSNGPAPVGNAPSPDLNASPEKPMQVNQVCRYFANGFCSRGDRCNYLHMEQGFVGNGAVHKTRFKNGRVPIPASRYANLKIEECEGEIASMCLDQHGCRYLQRQLDTGDAKLIQLIFTEVNVHIVELMSDPFGNYLCQKLIEHCSESQRLEIVKSVAPDLVQISKNMHGTRAVQKLIEHLGSSEENKLVRNALKGSVVALIQDLNGNHVIQKCLHKMEPNDNQFIYDAVTQHCVQVSTHRHGCCVMQRCIDHATYDQKLQLVEEIKKTALTLVQDAFGNYVVQYALDLEIPSLPTDLIKQLQTRLHFLSKQKFSSNVVEKCLRCGSSECVARVLREFLGENPDGTGPPVQFATSAGLQQKLVELLQDSFGNYVIQTCLSEGASKAPAEYLRMSALLRPYVHQLRNAPYIKRIYNLLNLPTSSPATATNGSQNQNQEGNDSDTLATDLGSTARRQRRGNRKSAGSISTVGSGIHSNGVTHSSGIDNVPAVDNHIARIGSDVVPATTPLPSQLFYSGFHPHHVPSQHGALPYPPHHVLSQQYHQMPQRQSALLQPSNRPQTQQARQQTAQQTQPLHPQQQHHVLHHYQSVHQQPPSYQPFPTAYHAPHQFQPKYRR